GDRLALQVAAFLTACHAARGRVLVELLVENVGGAVGNVVQRVPSDAAQVIGQLVRGDGEQVRLQLTAVVEVGQAVEKADESFLDDVVAGGAVVQAAIDEGQQAALVARDELVPGARVPLADLLDKKTISVG